MLPFSYLFHIIFAFSLLIFFLLTLEPSTVHFFIGDNYCILAHLE